MNTPKHTRDPSIPHNGNIHSHRVKDLIPDHWSPQQAFAVSEFLGSLHHAIWQIYEKPLVDIILNQSTDDHHDNDTLDHDLNDDIPF